MSIRVRGIVQGVGFRPSVWRLARTLGVHGEVQNDADGVLIQAWGPPTMLQDFVRRLQQEPPPLARIDTVEVAVLDTGTMPDSFDIVTSKGGQVRTDVSPDTATCPACLADINDPHNRRYRYPFTNCTHCGPRLSIIRAVPYDRDNTSMAPFAMCPACLEEYGDPTDRRFHAQPNACPDCGPRVWLEGDDGRKISSDEAGDARDAIDAAASLIEQGAIVAIKGIGGIHLACNACNAQAVRTLRQRKQRDDKPFALMAADDAMVERYAMVGEAERTLLRDRAAPIVILHARGEAVAEAVAPGQCTLGFMLPYTPLHHLLMQQLEHPIVLTSGNRSDEPQSIDNEDARRRLRGIADYFLLHDRDIVNRQDDSVVRVMAGDTRLLRRARGYAPAPLPLPEGFDESPTILAMGAELKNTFCLTQHGKAILSQHMGDLEEAATLEDYYNNLTLFRSLFDHEPRIVAVDRHPDYLSTKTGRQLAIDAGLKLVPVQHHHAHIAACMAEHGLPLDAPPVLGIALDGLGLGDDGTFWGGEFLLADYRGYRRLARFLPVAMPGSTRAILEPWRNAYAHLALAFDRETLQKRYGDSDIVRYLEQKPLSHLESMMDKGLNSPLASSCGRLFDAVAASIGICRDRVSYEGQAAMQLEALAIPHFDAEWGNAYGHDWHRDDGIVTLAWSPMWRALLDDTEHGVDRGVIAARFHHGLAQAVVSSALRLCRECEVGTVVLGGGVFQNRLLLEAVRGALVDAGVRVFVPGQVPANDGGLSLGQAAVAAATAVNSNYWSAVSSSSSS